MIHNFKKSKVKENKNTWIHDKVIKEAFDKIGTNVKNSENKNMEKTYHFLSIDRKSCDFNTITGKEYQRKDIDGLIQIEVEENGQKVVSQKTLSEKTRGKYYGDIYLEIISVLSLDKNSEFNVIDDYGWANKFCIAKEPNSAQYLNIVFIDKKSNQYKAIFIPDYQKLKNKLFHTEDGILKDLIGNGFIKKIAEEIKKAEAKGNSNFKIKAVKQPYENIIGAKNKTRNGQYYYTIGLTFSFEYLKELGIKLKEFNGVLDNKVTNNIPMKKLSITKQK